MKWSLALMISLTAFLRVMGVAPAYACACCAEPGEIQQGRLKVDSYIRAELRSIRFGRNATLFTTAAGWDAVRGIDSPDETDDYTLEVKTNADRWAFTFRSDKRAAGTLTLRIPERIELYAVDTTPRPRRYPRLRKEWRINAAVTGTGVFAKGLSEGKTIASLVFHGKGNACTDATQFNYWTLDVKGPGARFRFFGKLKVPGS